LEEDVMEVHMKISPSIPVNRQSIELQALVASLPTGTPFDTVKIAQIKTAIREGRLAVSAGAIADRMLAAVTDLLNTKAR